MAHYSVTLDPGHFTFTPGKPRVDFAKAQATLTVDLDPTWEVAYTLALQPPGRPVVVALRVALRPGVDAPPGGLLGETLKRVRIGDHARALAALVHAGRRAPADSTVWQRWAALGPARAAVERVPSSGRGRPRLDDAELARAAQAYVAAIEARSPRPVLEAARQLGETADRVRGLLHRARRRKLLRDSRSGVAAGILTPRARAVLRSPPTKRGRR
jgi:hypothetical protein